MLPIDLFIDQLIQLGLAESFLEIITKHYLKVTEIYNIISSIDTNNVKSIDGYLGEDSDSMTIILCLYNPIDDIIVGDINDFTVQTNNNGNTVEITVTNNYESEEELYEIRLNGRRKSYNHKWS